MSSYRGPFGAPRPPALGALALPPAPMAARAGLRPLKAWRYVGVFGPELMLCAGSVRIGPARQAFWAVWDRTTSRLYERTVIGRGHVALPYGGVRVDDGEVLIDLELDERDGVETVSPSGRSYAWTRKQGGIRARGVVRLGEVEHQLKARAVVDDTAAYYERHTRWRWSAGVGVARDGREVAWNLVAGVNDPLVGSERSIWVDGAASEIGPTTFSDDLSRVDFAEGGALGFAPESARERRENLLLVRSFYRQPFGTFTGELPGGLALADGYGVMEEHDAWW